jgi:16S rRNA C1402 (ribose-2'-O) methylase RsmI
MPDHRICVAREMTKKFEEFIHGTADEILKKKESWKGEIVLLI